ncbi:hypothetical protein H0H81_011780 [Sphagnurus paluster]|uniref:Uncharacterized protein n=1 Tax=Sphagnurus paluster TaxID=117069 RepID=A0A9P7FS74_9AGAR|nr:hypothetical protein H0H81_011780 [Sphagnurus paluster]
MDLHDEPELLNQMIVLLGRELKAANTTIAELRTALEQEKAGNAAEQLNEARREIEELQAKLKKNKLRISFLEKTESDQREAERSEEIEELRTKLKLVGGRANDKVQELQTELRESNEQQKLAERTKAAEWNAGRLRDTLEGVTRKNRLLREEQAARNGTQPGNTLNPDAAIMDDAKEEMNKRLLREANVSLEGELLRAREKCEAEERKNLRFQMVNDGLKEKVAELTHRKGVMANELAQRNLVGLGAQFKPCYNLTRRDMQMIFEVQEKSRGLEAIKERVIGEQRIKACQRPQMIIIAQDTEATHSGMVPTKFSKLHSRMGVDNRGAGDIAELQEEPRDELREDLAAAFEEREAARRCAEAAQIALVQATAVANDLRMKLREIEDEWSLINEGEGRENRDLREEVMRLTGEKAVLAAEVEKPAKKMPEVGPEMEEQMHDLQNHTDRLSRGRTPDAGPEKEEQADKAARVRDSEGVQSLENAQFTRFIKSMSAPPPDLPKDYSSLGPIKHSISSRKELKTLLESILPPSSRFAEDYNVKKRKVNEEAGGGQRHKRAKT